MCQAEFQTYFYKPDLPQPPNTAAAGSDRLYMDTAQGFSEIQAQFSAENTKEIDVRHLEMPIPMETLLRELAVLPNTAALYVHHKRIPIYLLEELADQAFNIHVLNLGENDVKLFIYHSRKPWVD